MSPTVTITRSAHSVAPAANLDWNGLIAAMPITIVFNALRAALTRPSATVAGLVPAAARL